MKPLFRIIGVAAAVLLVSVAMVGAGAAEEINPLEPVEEEIEDDFLLEDFLVDDEFIPDEELLLTGSPLLLGTGDSQVYYLRVEANELQYSSDGETWTSVTVLKISDEVYYYQLIDGVEYRLVENVNLSGLHDLVVTGKTTLDLNGFVLKGTGKGSVIIIRGTGELTLESTDSTTPHYFTVDEGLWVWDSTKEGTTGEQAGYQRVTGGVITGGTGVESVSGDKKYHYGGGIFNSGTFTMSGGNIVGNSVSDTAETTFTSNNGGGVYNSGKFTLNDGNIVGNTAGTHGGAVYTNKSFTMNGGNIIENTALSNGGGVCNAGLFTMYSGTIGDNSASNFGGGIYSGKELSVFGGSINNNTASSGGGICINGETFNTTGGNITSNTVSNIGGGVYFKKGTVTVGGSVYIFGNSSGTTSVKSDNLYVGDNISIQLSEDSKLIDGAKIGITVKNGSAGSKVSSNYPEGAPGSGYYDGWAKYFISDNHSYYIEKGTVGSTECLVLGSGKHVHDGMEFEPWNDSTTLPGPGCYYLTADVTISGTWEPSDGTSICLNGHVITVNGVTVGSDITFTLCDCCMDQSHRHYFTVDDSGLWKLPNDTTVSNYVDGGVITGVCGINNTGMLYMNGGNIVGNTGTGNGGGVYDGGGVYNSGEFTLNDGNIVGNTATGNGGGVYNEGTLKMNGGNIVGNTATGNGGGVYNNGSMTVGGNASIKSNLNGSKKVNNIYLPSGKVVKIADMGLTGVSESIGVTVGTYPSYGESVNLTDNYKSGAEKIFFSDDVKYYLINDNVIKLKQYKEPEYTVVIPPSVSIENVPIDYTYSINVNTAGEGNHLNIVMTLSGSTGELNIVHNHDSSIKIPYTISRITPSPKEGIVVNDMIIAAPVTVVGITDAILRFTKDDVQRPAGTYSDKLTFLLEVL